MLDDRMAALEAEYHAVEAELADPATLSDAGPPARPVAAPQGAR